MLIGGLIQKNKSNEKKTFEGYLRNISTKISLKVNFKSNGLTILIIKFIFTSKQFYFERD
jgi:hypothetical protein